MKSNKIIASVSALLIALTVCGCSGNGNKNDGKDYKLSEYGIQEKYMPSLEDVDMKLNGDITVALVFGETKVGWDAMIKEYQSMHKGQVSVKTSPFATEEAYQLTADTSVKAGSWDLVQGNLLLSTTIKNYCVDMNSYISGRNAYVGNNRWAEVLETNAYTTDKSGSNSICYQMNSMTLNTAWFVRNDTFEEIKAAGYTGSETPSTWTELMSMCQAMKDVGYQYPLGISLDTSSIKASQFTWLLRVYGDYYYRDLYEYVNKNATDYTAYDKTATQPESENEFAFGYAKLANTILCEDSALDGGEAGSTFAGPKSERFKDMLSKFAEMKNYISTTSASGVSFDTMRNNFKTQSLGKDSPQIILDYSGEGLGFTNVAMFDYPEMVNEYTPEGTITRDVGGNGGYLSIVDNDNSKITLDFLKFVMSPYGQSVYYSALATAGFAPQGLSTVKYAKTPDTWKQFFENENVTFTGLADSNAYITWLIRGMGGDLDATQDCATKWANFMTDASKTTTYLINQFTTSYTTTLEKAWVRCATAQSWTVDDYKNGIYNNY